MKLTPALKGLLKSKFGLKEGATDEEAKKLLDEKYLAGELTVDEIIAAEKGAADQVKTLITDEVAKATNPLAEAIKALTEQVAKGAQAPAVAPAPAPAGEKAGDEDLDARIAAALAKHGSAYSEEDVIGVFMKSGAISKGAQPRVKAAVEQYSDERPRLDAKSVGLAKMSGIKEAMGSEGFSLPSERGLAMIGAWFKHQLKGMIRQGLPLRGFEWTEHDEQLYAHLLHEEKWCGSVGGKEGTEFIRKLRGSEVKGLLDDSTSGGQEAVPLVYDNAVIQTAILTGELFPYVNLIELNRGNSIHAYSISRPTLQANVAEGTAMSLFDTTAFIAALNTTIHTAVGAMELGLDWQEDSPVDVGRMVVTEYGEAVKKYYDDCIATGDGTTQPTGIFTASNTVKVPSALGSTGPLTVGDFQNLWFGLTKEERDRTPSFLAYFGNDSKYQQALSIPVGDHDARRMFGQAGPNMEVGSGANRYTTNGYPFKVSHSCADSQFGFGNLKRYRFYRRLGATLRYVTDGQTLVLKNTALIVLRTRIGGQPELGAAFAVMTNTPTA